MAARMKGGGGLPGNDLVHPGSPRYRADLYGIAVRLPKDRVDLCMKIVQARAEHAQRDGRARPMKLSEVLRQVFDLGVYELQVREAVAAFTRKPRLFSLREVADHVRLPEPLLRKELAARGIQVAASEEDVAPWPPRFQPVGAPEARPDLREDEGLTTIGPAPLA